MQSLESYIQMGGQYHPLIDAAIIHYFFEIVYPFSDGNGRLGRLLIILYLASEGYLESPYIYPSAYFNRHKVEYVERMRAVSEEGAWDEWLTFFLEGCKRKPKHHTIEPTSSVTSNSDTKRSTQVVRARTNSPVNYSSTPISLHLTSWSISVSHDGLPTKSSTTSKQMVSSKK
nr:Fic family protein [Halorussus aquaticus]